MIKSNLLKLCWLVEQRCKVERLYQRAKWNVSYYKKQLVVENSKWDRTQLIKKIECARLLALKRQKQLLDIRKKLYGPIAIEIKKLKTRLISKSGVIVAIEIQPTTVGKYTRRTINTSEIVSLADEYEADQVLTKVLTKGNNND